MGTETQPHVSTSRGKGYSKMKILAAAAVIVLVFVSGLYIGKWLKTNEITGAAKQAVGTQPLQGDKYKVTVLGIEVVYSDDNRANAELNKKVFTAATPGALSKASIADVLVVYNMAVTTNEPVAMANAKSALQKRVKELSAEQKSQLQAAGVDL